MNPPANSLYVGKHITYRHPGRLLAVGARITHLCGSSVLVDNGDTVPVECITTNPGQSETARSA